MKSIFKVSITTLVSVVMLATQAFAIPVLRGNVNVNTAIVTVGDMFDGADILAERALFQSPNPGTAGSVSIEAVQIAAARVGLTDFSNPGVIAVEVRRHGTLIDNNLITGALRQDLERQGVLTDEITADIYINNKLAKIYADDDTAPLTLLDLRYQSNGGQFTASFSIAGQIRPLDVSGRLELYVDMPHLTGSLGAGALLTPDNLEMRRTQLRFAQASGMPEISQLVGKQLRRPARAGMMLKSSDVEERQIIARNDAVTVYLKKGPLTLTVKGQALNSASYGEKVSVLNALSNKVINGFAVDTGTVQLGDHPLSNASL